jgi:hypothetical protein
MASKQNAIKRGPAAKRASGKRKTRKTLPDPILTSTPRPRPRPRKVTTADNASDFGDGEGEISIQEIMKDVLQPTKNASRKLDADLDIFEDDAPTESDYNEVSEDIRE